MSLQRIGAIPHVTDSQDEVLVTFLDTETGLLKNVLIRGDAARHAAYITHDTARKTKARPEATLVAEKAALDTAAFEAAEAQDAALKERNRQDEAGKPAFPVQEIKVSEAKSKR